MGRLFLCGSKVLQNQCEENEGEKKVNKKTGQFLEVCILFTTNSISFKFDMQGHVYIEH